MWRHLHQLPISYTSALLNQATSVISVIRKTVLSQKLIPKLIWTPLPHSTLGNELVNLADKENEKWRPSPLEPTEISDLINILRKYVSQDWNMYWKTLPKNNKLRHIKLVLSLWRRPVPISRKLEIFLHRPCLAIHTLHMCSSSQINQTCLSPLWKP